MEISDLDDVLEIEKRVFPYTSWSRISFEMEIYSPFSSPYVLLLENRVIGYIVFHTISEETHITNFAIQPEYQNKGYGKFLFKFAIDNIRNSKSKSIYLEVRASNLRAQHIYEKFGFKKIGIRKKYYSNNNEDAIIMALFLDNN